MVLLNFCKNIEVQRPDSDSDTITVLYSHCGRRSIGPLPSSLKYIPVLVLLLVVVPLLFWWDPLLAQSRDLGRVEEALL